MPSSAFAVVAKRKSRPIKNQAAHPICISINASCNETPQIHS